MVRTLENFVTPEQIQWFRADMAEFFLAGDYTEQRDDSTDIFDKFGVADTFVKDRRHTLNQNDPGYQLVKKLLHTACPELPENLYFYMAYQRQYFPHAQHVDAIGPDGDPTHAYTAVIPLDENVNGIFKTLVWDKDCWTYEEFNDFRWDFIDNEQKYPKIGNVTELYDVDHCETGRNLADYIPLEGVYEYQLGTAGIFKRTHVHASSNWHKYKLFDHKDIIILHIGG
jgi:hypothetical protein